MEYNVVVGVIRVTKKTYEDCISQLITSEGELSILNNGTDEDTKPTALYNRDTTICNYWSKKGHDASRCFFNPDSSNYRPQLAKKRNDRRRGRDNNNRFNRTYGRNYKNTDNRNAENKNASAAYVDISLFTKLQESTTTPQNERPDKIKQKWFLDSGASAHMCNDATLFRNMKPNTGGIAVSVGDGKHATVSGIGTVICDTVTKGITKKVELKDVLCLPSLICNLISVSRITTSGLTAMFKYDNTSRCEVRSINPKVTFMTAIEKGNTGLYEAMLKPIKKEEQALIHTACKGSLWHEGLAHVSDGTLEKSVPLLKGIGVKTISPSHVCEASELSKSTRGTRPRASEESRQATKRLELVHTVIVGPMKRPSLRGSRYFIPLMDDASGVSLVRFLKEKSEATTAVQEMINQLETICKGKVERIRSDNGKEFTSHTMQEWLKTRGITQELTAPYSPESNGKAERLNRTLLEMARTMLNGASKAPGYKTLWAEAAHTANYIRNRLYTTPGKMTDKTPYEVAMNKKPDLSHIRIFGTESFVHIPKQKRQDKMGERVEIGYCVGFTSGNGYKIYLLQRRIIIVSRDVPFDEQVGAYQQDENRERGVAQAQNEQLEELDHSTRSLSADAESSTGSDDPAEQDITTDTNTRMEGTETVTYYPNLRRSSRTPREPERFVSGVIALMNRLGNEDHTAPLTYLEAMRSCESHEWKAAMTDEMKSLQEHTLKLVPLPPHTKPVKCKWVYMNKTDVHNNIILRRARLVAKGYSQKDGIHFNEVFPPIAKYTTVRFLLALSVKEEMDMVEVDVKSAFLNRTVGQRILTNFFVLYDTFLDASLFTVRAFLTMIRQCMAVRARSFSASATTGHIWCPVLS